MTRSVVVPTDFSDVSKAAFPFAAELARRFEAEVALVHVLPALPHLMGAAATHYSEFEQAVEEQARGELDALAKDEVFEELEVETVLSTNAPAAPAIGDIARDREAVAVVVSTHGRRGARRLLLGSVAEEVVRTSTVPVLTVGRDVEMPKSGGSILVPVDFSPGSMFAVEAAARLSVVLDLEIVLAHVVEPPRSPFIMEALPEGMEKSRGDLEEEARQRLEELAEDVGFEAPHRVVTAFGGAEERIVRLGQALGPSMVVIGSHGRRGLGRAVLGSVAEGVVRAARWPTLVVKDGDAFASWPSVGFSTAPSTVGSGGVADEG